MSGFEIIVCGKKCIRYEQIAIAGATSLLVPPGVDYALIQADGADARYTLDGTTPTATVGMLLANGDLIQVFDSLSDFQAAAVNGSPKLNISYFRTSRIIPLASPFHAPNASLETYDVPAGSNYECQMGAGSAILAGEGGQWTIAPPDLTFTTQEGTGYNALTARFINKGGHEATPLHSGQTFVFKLDVTGGETGGSWIAGLWSDSTMPGLPDLGGLYAINGVNILLMVYFADGVIGEDMVSDTDFAVQFDQTGKQFWLYRNSNTSNAWKLIHAWAIQDASAYLGFWFGGGISGTLSNVRMYDYPLWSLAMLVNEDAPSLNTNYDATATDVYIEVDLDLRECSAGDTASFYTHYVDSDNFDRIVVTVGGGGSTVSRILMESVAGGVSNVTGDTTNPTEGDPPFPSVPINQLMRFGVRMVGDISSTSFRQPVGSGNLWGFGLDTTPEAHNSSSLIRFERTGNDATFRNLKVWPVAQYTPALLEG